MALDTRLEDIVRDNQRANSPWRNRQPWSDQNYYVSDNICLLRHHERVAWLVEFHPEFVQEYRQFTVSLREEVLAHAGLSERFGPQFGRPQVDSLKDSAHANMKELRFFADQGVWRLALAFDPRRRAILLVAGDKSGSSERRFYRDLIRTADKRFGEHLTLLKSRKEKGHGEDTT